MEKKPRFKIGDIVKLREFGDTCAIIIDVVTPKYHYVNAKPPAGTYYMDIDWADRNLEFVLPKEVRESLLYKALNEKDET